MILLFCADAGAGILLYSSSNLELSDDCDRIFIDTKQ